MYQQMHPVIKKLQFRGQAQVLVLQAPAEFREVLAEWKQITAIDEAPGSRKSYPLAIGFVVSAAEVRSVGNRIIKHLAEDAIFWMAYPKKSSKKYQATITRDQGWEFLGENGYEGVAMVAIDADWSALRLRKAEKIGKMIRRQGMAMSATGKKKTINKTNTAIRASGK